MAVFMTMRQSLKNIKTFMYVCVFVCVCVSACLCAYRPASLTEQEILAGGQYWQKDPRDLWKLKNLQQGL